MNSNRSVATIDKPEFINLEPFNPFLSTCEIKVLYLGENRNRSYIDKNTAIQMANSLPGTPIVGAFREEIDDFGDHGHVVRIEDGEIRFSCKTRPYGFVAPDAQVWFQKFVDTDEFGNETTREYMMTTGYLWTHQYKEAMDVINHGKGQSMELDEETLDGHWATNNNTGIDFFIINDAIFTKLCILGDDVEPCFEGAAVTSPQVSKNFAKDADFQKTLFTMMNELKEALQNKGGSDMAKSEVLELQESVEQVETEENANDAAGEFTHLEYDEDGSDAGSDGDAAADDSAEGVEAEADVTEEPEDAPGEEEPPAEDDEDETPADSTVSDDDDDDEGGLRKIKYTSEEYQELEAKYSLLEQEVQALREFKNNVENEKKDALINKYYMLDEDDKKDIIDHKSEYSIEEIESKLAVLYVQKNVDFDSLGETEEDDADSDATASVTFSLDEASEMDVAPAYVEALRQARK